MDGMDGIKWRDSNEGKQIEESNGRIQMQTRSLSAKQSALIRYCSTNASQCSAEGKHVAAGPRIASGDSVEIQWIYLNGQVSEWICLNGRIRIIFIEYIKIRIFKMNI